MPMQTHTLHIHAEAEEDNPAPQNVKCVRGDLLQIHKLDAMAMHLIRILMQKERQRERDTEREAKSLATLTAQFTCNFPPERPYQGAKALYSMKTNNKINKISFTKSVAHQGLPTSFKQPITSAAQSFIIITNAAVLLLHTVIDKNLFKFQKK